MELVITPVIKNKGGDLTDINNYRAIAISNADTKILEKLLLPFMTSLADCELTISLVLKPDILWLYVLVCSGILLIILSTNDQQMIQNMTTSGKR